MLLLARRPWRCCSATGTARRPRRRPPAPRWPCSPSACPGSAPTSTSCASCSRCSAPRSPSTSTWSRTALNIVLALVLVHPLGVRGLALSLSIAYTVAARRWPWPSSASGSAAWPSRETWAPLWRVVMAIGPHGRRRARRLQPLGVDQRRRAAGPGGRRRRRRRPHLRRGRDLAGPAPRRRAGATAAAGPAPQPVRAPRRGAPV